MKYRIYNKTTQNIEPGSWKHYDEAITAWKKAMGKSENEDFSILNEREA